MHSSHSPVLLLFPPAPKVLLSELTKYIGFFKRERHSYVAFQVIGGIAKLAGLDLETRLYLMLRRGYAHIVNSGRSCQCNCTDWKCKLKLLLYSSKVDNDHWSWEVGTGQAGSMVNILWRRNGGFQAFWAMVFSGINHQLYLWFFDDFPI